MSGRSERFMAGIDACYAGTGTSLFLGIEGTDYGLESRHSLAVGNDQVSEHTCPMISSGLPTRGIISVR